MRDFLSQAIAFSEGLFVVKFLEFGGEEGVFKQILFWQMWQFLTLIATDIKKNGFYMHIFKKNPTGTYFMLHENICG